MKLTNATKKLEKFTKVNKKGDFYFARKNGREIELLASYEGDEVSTIRVRPIYNKNDAMHDYCNGIFCADISQAIKLAHW